MKRKYIIILIIVIITIIFLINNKINNKNNLNEISLVSNKTILQTDSTNNNDIIKVHIDGAVRNPRYYRTRKF